MALHIYRAKIYTKRKNKSPKSKLAIGFWIQEPNGSWLVLIARCPMVQFIFLFFLPKMKRSVSTSNRVKRSV